jgi:IMP cyclohydrolase
MNTELDSLVEKNLKERLKDNSYPGRGIVVGQVSPEKWAIVYWIMGRSANSRNRCFVEQDGNLQTVPADPRKVEDPSLILYNAVRRWNRCWIVTNGSHTDVIVEELSQGNELLKALETQRHEPDAPNFTPRISGLLDFRAERPTVYLSSLRQSQLVPEESDHRLYQFRRLMPGYGYALTTYLQDGNPLPTYDAPPFLLPLFETPRKCAEFFWEKLHSENRISLAVFHIHAESLEQEMHIINANALSSV